MKKYLLSLIAALAATGVANAQYSATPDGITIKSELQLDGLITAENYVRHHAATIDASGNTFVSAAFDTDFFEIQPIGVSAMIVKLNDLGLKQWIAPIVGAATVKSLVSDGNGGVYAAGVFADEVEFQGTDGATIVKEGYQEGGAYTTSQAASFIAHYDAEGKLLAINKVVPEHDPNLDNTGMYYPIDGDVFCTIHKLMKDGDKLYAQFDYCGKVTALVNSATSGSMDMEGWGVYYQAMKAAGVAELDENLAFKKVLVNINTNNFSQLYNNQQIFSSTAAIKDGQLYVGAIGNGDVNIAAFDGGFTISHQLPQAGGYNLGYLLTRFNLSNPSDQNFISRIGYTDDEYVASSMSDMFFSGDLLIVTGNFQDELGFDKTITATGSSDLYAAAINPLDLAVLTAKASGYDEGDATKNEEIFTSSTVCGNRLFINGYTANKSDHSLNAPLCYIYDMTNGSLTNIDTNGGYIFGTAANAAGDMLLNAWAASPFTASNFSTYSVSSGGVSDATIGKAGVKAYPNPATDYLHFTETCDVQLSALSGATVAAAKGVNTLNVAALPAGVYVAKLTTQAATTTVKVIIK